MPLLQTRSGYSGSNGFHDRPLRDARTIDRREPHNSFIANIVRRVNARVSLPVEQHRRERWLRDYHAPRIPWPRGGVMASLHRDINAKMSWACLIRLRCRRRHVDLLFDLPMVAKSVRLAAKEAIEIDQFGEGMIETENERMVVYDDGE